MILKTLTKSASKNVRTSALTLVLAAVCLISGVSYADPPPIAESPCDPDYYDSMEARAWLEAQREITQNQNLIFKPDSVLEYTCFNQFLTVLADNADDMFSATNRWSTAPPGNMAGTLGNLIGEALNSYITANYNHPYLGGRQDGISASGAAYSCDIMQKVWMKAKCFDFMHTPDKDGFFTFEEYSTSTDKRFLPDVCPHIQTRWQNEIKAAYDHNVTAWTEDDVVTFFNKLDPANCSSADKIATGIKVRRSQAPTEYDEKICLAPGCYYVPTSETAGSCQPNL
jgi:hypothetical protein